MRPRHGFCLLLLCKNLAKHPKALPGTFWKRLPNKAQPGTFVTIHQCWLVSHEREQEGGKKMTKKKTPTKNSFCLDARLS